MADAQAFEKDPLEGFLDSGLPTALSAELRQAVLVRTTRLLRRRRRLKRAGYVIVMVACYLLGLGTMQLWTGTPQATTGTATTASAPTPGPAQAALPLDEDPKVPAFVLERMAQSCPESRACLYRRAGDCYLAEGDFKSALHCYGRSLDAGSKEDWIVTRDDNWLLMQLKTARQEEKSYAKSAG